MGGAETTRMWAMMETPTAIFNVREIASVHQVAEIMEQMRVHALEILGGAAWAAPIAEGSGRKKRG